MVDNAPTAAATKRAYDRLCIAAQGSRRAFREFGPEIRVQPIGDFVASAGVMGALLMRSLVLVFGPAFIGLSCPHLRIKPPFCEELTMPSALV